MRVVVAVGLALCVVCLLGAGVGAAADVPGSAPGAAQVDGEDEDPEDREAVTQLIRIEIGPEGNAQFIVSTQFFLQGEDERAAFDRLATEFEEDGEVGPSAEPFEDLAEQAGEETDREMDVENVSKHTDVENDSEDGTNATGTLTLEFTWTEFAAVDDDGRLTAEDVFTVEDELWLPTLTENQRLEIAAPDGYGVSSAPTSVSNGVLVWEGPHTFEADDFEDEPIMYAPGGGIGGAGGITPLTVAFAGVLLLVVGLLAFVVFGGREAQELPVLGTLAGGATTAAGAGEGDGGRSSPDPDDPFAGVNEELLSDEERVIRLLRANDGRMKQAMIVQETQWSNAKVSQLLSSMADDGEIDKLRIGRENLITLRGESPDE
ncbi:DUF7345 domain-containing protein [Natronorarus salvus]|uniref:DUF7345 domain-containing protein n=1 Tax=Natronorarus salvus TaxID=3117733 RepID=UPI002F266D1C